MTDIRKSRFWYWGLFSVILLGAVYARYRALHTDFFLDEIWTLELSRVVKNPLQILTAIHQDNNHHLNTLFFYVLGEQPNWIYYRLLSWVCGTLLVLSAGLHYGRADRVLGTTLMVLFGFSLSMVLSSSEARGYGQAAFFSMWSFWVLKRHLETRDMRSVFFFFMLMMLGTLSHLTYIYVYGGALLWSAYHFRNTSKKRRVFLKSFFTLHGLPLAFLAFVYWIDVSRYQVGGGPLMTPAEAVQRALSLALGIPEHGTAAVLLIVLISGVVAAELWFQWKEKSEEWTFFAGAILVMPFLVNRIYRHTLISERYFFICMPFVLFVLASFLVRCSRRGVGGKIIYGSVLLCFMLSNAKRLQHFYREGHGTYLTAVLDMASQTRGTVITVGSDHDFRNGLVLMFYARYLPPTQSLHYFNGNALNEKKPQWIFAHSLDPETRASSGLSLRGGTRYALSKTYPYSGYDGWTWFLYRRVDL